MESAICIISTALTNYRPLLVHVLKADLDSTTLLITVVCNFCSVHCLGQSKIVYSTSFLHFDCGYNCCRFLKHVSKSYNSFCVVYHCREDVVRLI